MEYGVSLGGGGATPLGGGMEADFAVDGNGDVAAIRVQWTKRPTRTTEKVYGLGAAKA